MASLSTAAFQARLNIGTFSGRKRDKSVSESVAYENQVDASVGNYWKNVLRCPQLDDIRNIGAACRADYYKHSTMWLEGVRVMPVQAYEEFAPRFRRYSYDWNTKLSEFLSKYDDLVIAEKSRLKGMYNPADYPSRENMKSKFYMDFKIFPFPDVDTDFRIQLMREEVEGVKAQIREEFVQAQRSAVTDILNRIFERMQSMNESLSDVDRRVHQSMFENVSELCNDIKKLNFMNDPDIEAIRQDIMNNVASLNVEAIRAETGIPGGIREEAAKRTAAIAERVKGIWGAN